MGLPRNQMTPERRITQKEYMTALGLFAAARNHYAQGKAIEDRLAKVLGMTEFWESHMADLMFDESANEKKFKRALSRDRIILIAENT